MPALSSNLEERHHLFPDTVATVFVITLLALGIALLRRKLLFGSVFISSSQYQALKMSANEYQASEKSPPRFQGDENGQGQEEREPMTTLSNHARSLSSQLPPPTIKPFLPPLSSASNAEYFSRSPITETPSSFAPSSSFSPSATFSQSTSFSEAPERSTDGQTRRRSYTKTLSLPLPNQPILHPSAQTTFPTPTSHPAPDAFIQPGGPAPVYMPVEGMMEVEVQGEIIVAEGWRRHTRVFGGGVCKACEESKSREVERRGTA
ncbi:hypothetical protein BJ875DRAFT_66504 [Amylocarpus encephaloides]|uniref:Uncharacterized protein n=1 Tax=Amylocarpus encephaloides TaxID=45428 RepID=A0A9P8C467_9HELO|nr:hypothetical protein BJ875DRAFT_66504 [Amylocarpus encephaloides]